MKSKSINEIEGAVSSNSCWTCRRRRVKCDRRLPECLKCSSSGDHCQGYGEARPLRWTNGVASRGKLMGKRLPIRDSKRISFPIIMSLEDPATQDLSPTNRQYIKYFDRYCSVESTLYDDVATNSFREFMRLIPSSMALTHTMISIAALHQSRRKPNDSFIKLEYSLCSENYSVTSESSYSKTIEGDPCAMYHSLKHKQYALEEIRKRISVSNLKGIEGILASILLLVWQDLMESGKDSWRHHLDALKGITEASRSSVQIQRPYKNDFDFDGLERHFELTYAALQILGTTFSPKKSPYQPLFSLNTLKEIMNFSDSEIWAGCPAGLLYVISILNDISRFQVLPPEFKTDIFPLLSGFSPINWAVKGDNPSLMKPRYHLASIYKQSVTIFMSQVLSQFQLPHGLNTSIDPDIVLDSALFHLQSISPEDPHFKGLVWPTFVIGAEARDVSKRMTVCRVFEQLSDFWRCQNVRNALNVLQDLWRSEDQRTNRVPWIGEIYRSGMDWIFV